MSSAEKLLIVKLAAVANRLFLLPNVVRIPFAACLSWPIVYTVVHAKSSNKKPHIRIYVYFQYNPTATLRITHQKKRDFPILGSKLSNDQTGRYRPAYCYKLNIVIG